MAARTCCPERVQKCGRESRKHHRLWPPRGEHAEQTLTDSGLRAPSVTPERSSVMDVVYERCCGLDIHKKTVVACVVVSGAGTRPRKELRTFGTMTPDLLALADWLAEQGVTHVAMESTGVYWQPIYNLLEDRFSLLLVNAQHVKAVPGRKTD